MAESNSRKWQGSTPPPQQRKAPTLLLVTLFAAALIGCLAGVAWWLGRAVSPQFVGFPICEFTDPTWPVNAFAEQDAKRLRRHFVAATVGSGQENQVLQQIRLRLDELKTVHDPVVMHVSALAVVHDDAILLIPADGKPGDAESWLPLDVLLSKLADCPSKKKLLLLDIAKPVAGPFRGVLTDRVADVLHQKLSGGNLPALVLTSTGPGELSVPNVDEAAGAFSLFVDRGLAGEADGSLGAGNDKSISVRELAAYVTMNTAHWARTARGRSQTPTLYGEGDFNLTVHSAADDGAKRPSADGLPKWLVDGWSERDSWIAAGGRWFAPHVIHGLENELQRHEALWLSRLGLPDSDRTQDSFGEVQRILREKWRRLRLAPLPFKTLVNRLRNPFDGMLELRQLLDQAPDALAAKPDDKKREAFNTDRAAWLANPKFKPHADAAIALIWDRLRAAPVHRNVLEFMVGLSSAIQPNPASLESAFIARLGKLADSETWKRRRAEDWPRIAVMQAVRTEQTRLELLAKLTPRAWPWMKPSVDRAIQQSGAAEAVFFRLDDGSIAAFKDAAEQARSELEAAERPMHELAQTADDYQRAWTALDQAWAELPGLSHGLARSPSVDLQPWSESISAANRLAKSMEQAGDAVPSVFEMRPIVEQLNTALDTVRLQVQPPPSWKPLSEAAKKLDAPMDLGQGRAIQESLARALSTPTANAADRSAMFAAMRTLSSRLNREALAQPAAKTNASPVDPLLLTVRRARIGVDLVILSAVPKWDGLEKQYSAAKVSRSFAAWQSLGEAMFEASQAPPRPSLGPRWLATMASGLAGGDAERQPAQQYRAMADALAAVWSADAERRGPASGEFSRKLADEFRAAGLPR